jgi:hypothetical protein
VFIGYPFGTKGYWFYNLHTQSIINSRDAVFHENIFPFALNLTHTFTDGSFLNPVSSSLEFPVSLPVPISDLSFDFSSSTTPTSPIISSSSSPSQLDHSSSSISDQPLSLPSFSVEPSSQPPIRKSSRFKTKPWYLQNYHCQLASSLPSILSSTAQKSGIPYSFSSSVSYDKLSPAYKHFCPSITSQPEPKFYHEAVVFGHWRDAMSVEISALEANKIWVVCDLPPNKRPIGCKWVYKVKFKADESIERYKARLVAKGYTQCEGLDYHDIFSPVAKMTTVRCFLALATANNWFLHQLDVNNAFLHGCMRKFPLSLLIRFLSCGGACRHVLPGVLP